MANQRRFIGAAALILAILTPGVFAPGEADVLTVDVSSSPTTVPEFAAIPPDSDTVPPWVQPETEGAGSDEGVRVRTLIVPIEPDPWAEAFAESSRLQGSILTAPPDYPIVVNREVRHFVERFTGTRRDVVGAWVHRAGRYLGMIRAVFRQKGLPEDLAWVAMVESGFNPVAVSRAGATGLWQFMAPTARRYGLRVDAWVDERLDPEKATVAAAAYLRDLHTLFGSWELAQAAYNAGEITIARAIRSTGATDFWALARTRHLRRETKDFVPQINAATLIGREPDRYGFAVGEVEPPVDTVAVPARTELRRLAAVSGVSPAVLRQLNAALVRGVTPPGGRWPLRVPAASRAPVLAALEPGRPAGTAPARAAGSDAARAGEVHVVRPRDTIGAIARRYGVALNDVIRWNGLDPTDTIRPGDRIRVAAARSADRGNGQGGFR
jgi:membrane-bound lytic murein transglycosylase D